MFADKGEFLNTRREKRQAFGVLLIVLIMTALAVPFILHFEGESKDPSIESRAVKRTGVADPNKSMEGRRIDFKLSQTLNNRDKLDRPNKKREQIMSVMTVDNDLGHGMLFRQTVDQVTTNSVHGEVDAYPINFGDPANLAEWHHDRQDAESHDDDHALLYSSNTFAAAPVQGGWNAMVIGSWTGETTHMNLVYRTKSGDWSRQSRENFVDTHMLGTGATVSGPDNSLDLHIVGASTNDYIVVAPCLIEQEIPSIDGVNQRIRLQSRSLYHVRANEKAVFAATEQGIEQYNWVTDRKTYDDTLVKLYAWTKNTRDRPPPAFTVDENRLFMHNRDGSIQVYDPVDQSLVTSLEIRSSWPGGYDPGAFHAIEVSNGLVAYAGQDQRDPNKSFVRILHFDGTEFKLGTTQTFTYESVPGAVLNGFGFRTFADEHIARISVPSGQDRVQVLKWTW